MNVKEIRRENLRMLATHLGGVAQMARRLNKSTSQMSHLIGPNPVKNIGDRIAADIERIFEKPVGWLDQMQALSQQDSKLAHLLQTDVDNVLQVPILSWEAALQWPHFSKCQDTNFAYLPILSHQASAQTFALLLDNDVMESPHGLSFPQGGFILVDSLREVSPNQFVLVRTERPQNLLFRQLVLDGGRHYLKPLNPRYPVTTLPQDATFLGVITQLQLTICP